MTDMERQLSERFAREMSKKDAELEAIKKSKWISCPSPDAFLVFETEDDIDRYARDLVMPEDSPCVKQNHKHFIVARAQYDDELSKLKANL